MKYKIHKEGYLAIGVAFLLIGAVETLLMLLIHHQPWVHFILLLAGIVFFALIVRFFRNPERQPCEKVKGITSGADGKVVAIEEVFENEYFNDKRKQVSVFMSPFNVHVNWYPVSGTIKYYKHSQGSYFIASHPKSSHENERSTVVVETAEGHEVLFRQIAGTVARRIVCNAREGKEVKRGNELGFIRFGSRFDLFLPLNAKIEVTLGQKVSGCSTLMATIPNGSSPTSQQGLKQ